MDNQEINKKPWYKQFWPWFLIIVPLSSMAFSINYARLAATTENSLVVDDYYKEGRGINLRLNKIENAIALNKKTVLMVADGQIALRFTSGVPETGEALKLNFFHTTLEAKDFSVLLSRDAQGIYRGSFDQDIKSKWRLTLTPLDEAWKIQQTRFLPQSQEFVFEP